MAEIKPFRGIVYNKDASFSLKDVTTPPYDVITKTEQEEFYAKSEFNIIRLILGKGNELDNSSDNRYTRASSYFKEWLSNGTLIQDHCESIYVCQQDYTLADGTKKARTGFIALTKLEDFSAGKIFPHEKTLSGPRSDRMKLIESCHCNFSQIFSLYSDKELTIDRIIQDSIAGRKPDMEVTDDTGITHRVFKVSDPETIKKVTELMRGKNLFIADGHHRYETALNFRDIAKRNGDLSEDSSYNYVMMYFSNMDGDGLVVFPTHRVLFNLQDYQIDFLKAEVSKYFIIIDYPFTNDDEIDVRERFLERLASEGEKKHSFGMYVKGDTSYHLLLLDDKKKVASILKDDMADSLKGLDVTILHSVIIDHLLGVGTAAQENQENLRYVKGSDKAIDLVKNEDYHVTFFLNATKVEQVRAVASSGNKMPQKSTFFYPKLLTGLVINNLNSK